MNQKNSESNINFKSEAWKYTPQKSFNLSDFILKDYDQDSYSWGLGPNESQFQTMPYSDILADGNLKEYKIVELPFNDKIKRANLDSTLIQHAKNQKEFGAYIKESLGTTAWINANMMPTKFSLSLDKKAKQSFCIFESSQREGLSQEMKVHIEKDAELNLGLHLGSSEASYRQFNFVLEENSKLNLFSLFSGEAHYKRLEIRVYLMGKNTNININGLSLAKNKSVFDYHSDIIHLNEDQESNQLYRSLNQNQGHSIFAGRVHLTEDSTGAEVEQLNNNLLLDKKAKVDTQPELNIYQDDVKASHGATTGTLDEDHFFYFQSRGFKHEQAKKMLLEGFCTETLDAIEDTGLRSYFKNQIIEEL